MHLSHQYHDPTHSTLQCVYWKRWWCPVNSANEMIVEYITWTPSNDIGWYMILCHDDAADDVVDPTRSKLQRLYRKSWYYLVNSHTALHVECSAWTPYSVIWWYMICYGCYVCCMCVIIYHWVTNRLIDYMNTWLVGYLFGFHNLTATIRVCLVVCWRVYLHGYIIDWLIDLMTDWCVCVCDAFIHVMINWLCWPPCTMFAYVSVLRYDPYEFMWFQWLLALYILCVANLHIRI